MHILIEIMTEQVANPNKAVVNSECAFVKEKLQRRGLNELARQYWNWVCIGNSYDIFPQEVKDLQAKLKEIDASTSMPSWGYSGT